jgi:hypothetical protein
MVETIRCESRCSLVLPSLVAFHHHLSFLPEFLSSHLKKKRELIRESVLEQLVDVTTRIAAESCCSCMFSLFLRDKKWFRTRLEC